MFFNYTNNLNLQNTDVSSKNVNDSSKATKARKRIPFTKEEDRQLLQLVQYFGANDKNNWYFIASHIKGRTPRQCRERYQLFLCDNIRKKAKWTKNEDELLISKYKLLGPHWKQMEPYFNGRTSYNIKNRFISLNRRFKFTNESQSIFDNCSSLQNEVIQTTSSDISAKLDDHKDIDETFFNTDFEFDDYFPLFEGNENCTLFE